VSPVGSIQIAAAQNRAGTASAKSTEHGTSEWEMLMSPEAEKADANETVHQVRELPARYVMSLISPLFGGPLYLSLFQTPEASAPLPLDTPEVG
jgi:hypothetical protein